jgi:PAS domain S-box-containing protein
MQVYENQYRRLFESAKDGILILNADTGMILDVNPFLIEMLGYSKKRFLTKNIWDISAFKNIDYSKQLYKELQEKEYVRYEDIPLEASDGSLIDVEFVSNVYLVDNEKVIQCNVRDITNRKRKERTLEEDIKEKDALIKEIQHRTINSLTIIVSLIKLRGDMVDSEETKLILADLETKINSITDLYSLLSEFNTFYEVRVNLYCDKIITRMSELSNKIVINKNIPEIIVSNKKASTIGMILVELLFNAIKYAFPGSQKGVIEVTLKSINNRISLIVQDNGIGLPDNFDITKLKSLGLDLVSLMVNQLQGTITFDSEKGTKIIIEFPE